jgi:outer membrane lipoprotein SlyB
METPTSKSPHPLVWVAAISLIVFCAAGVGALMGWIPTSIGKPDEPVLTKLEQPAVQVPAQAPDMRARDRERERDRDRDRAKHAPAPAVVAAATRCAECGVIQSVREIDTKGEGSGLGAVGGAVAGGVLGSQIGGGNGKKVMAVVGAVGGAVAGNEIEKRVKATKSYEVTVRFDDGTSRVITEANLPSWRSGDKVKVINGVIQSNA